MTTEAGSHRRLPRSARGLVKRLREIKTQFSSEVSEEKLAILERLSQTEILTPSVLLEYHELLLFIRAYPDDRRIFNLVRRECDVFGHRVTGLRSTDADAAQKLEDTGIPRTGMYYSHHYATVVPLVKWFGDALDIDWEEFGETQKIDSLLPLFSEWAENDGLDLADISSEEWIGLRKGKRSSLRWLLESLKRSIPSYSVREHLYDSMDVPVAWDLGDSTACRTHGGLPGQKPYFHRDGLLRKLRDIREEIRKPVPSARLASPKTAEVLIRTIRSALAVRHRSIWPVGYANRGEVWVADLERGYQIVVYGVQPQFRLPIESNYGVLILKNGYVFGYGAGVLLFGQLEIAFNIFETWRGGESAFAFAQFLRVFHALFECHRFKIERYQIGYENEEGLQSGAFWFFYRLGFIPKEPKTRELARKEQARINKNRSYRSSVSILEKLAASDLYLDLGGDAVSIPDDFPLAELSLNATRMIGARFAGDPSKAIDGCTGFVARALGCPRWKQWPRGERESFERLCLTMAQISDLASWSETDRQALLSIMRAKGKPQEAEYARLVLKYPKVRVALEKIAMSPARDG